MSFDAEMLEQELREAINRVVQEYGIFPFDIGDTDILGYIMEIVDECDH